jgi:hypothetical protein
MFQQAADSHAPGVRAPTPAERGATKAPAKPAVQSKKPAVTPQKPPAEATGTEDPENLGFEPGDETPVEPAVAPEEAPAPETPAEAETPPAAPAKGKGPDPWKLVNSIKKERTALQREVTELRAKQADPELVTNLTKRAETAEARLKELDAEMHYVDYSKSQEFKEKHEIPWERAWKSAGKVIAELSVSEAEGATRPATLQDLVKLANMPLQEAHRAAVEMFGDLASTVMQHRQKIVELSEAREEDLATARKTAAERSQTQTQAQQQLRQETSELFQRFNDQQVKEQDFLRPREGDDEFNDRLEKARTFVRQTMASNLRDPKLTKEQRAQIMQRMVTVQNRAIGFSALRLENKRLKAELAKKNGALADFRGSEPGNGQGAKQPAGAVVSDPTQRLHSAIRQAADTVNYRP